MSIRCLFGHTVGKILVEYSREEHHRYYLHAGNRSIFLPHIEAKMVCKWQCVRCPKITVSTLESRRHAHESPI